MSLPLRLASTKLRPLRRVALVYSPIQAGVPLLSAVEKAQRRPGLGLRYLKAALVAQGIQVDLYDNLYDSAAAARVHEALNRHPYDLLGFHTSSASRALALDTVSRLHPRYAGRLVAGGPGVLHEDELLAGGFDLLFRGEGERRIVDLVRAYEGRVDFHALPGLAYLDEAGRKIRTGSPPLEDLTALPLPDWSDRDPLQGDMFNVTMKRPFYVMMASRGCPFRCGFCANHQLWKRSIRPRPVASVLDELQHLVDDLGARYVHFLDDIFAWEPRWLDAFCDGMQARRIQVDYSVVLHPLSFHGYRRRAFTRLRDTGCKLVSYGAQSADPQVLRNVRRSPAETQALREGVGILRELGMASVLTFIFGLPGDTRRTIRATTRFACELKPTIADFHPLLYLPGSEIADTLSRDACCTLDASTLNRLCWQASWEFYVRRGGGARLAAHILRHNPGWFRNLAPVGRWAWEYARMARDSRGTKVYL